MARKKPKEVEFVRHPFTKDRLQVTDSFEPNRDVLCPLCQEGMVIRVSVVQSEMQDGTNYYKIDCASCGNGKWLVAANRLRKPGHV